MQGAIYMPLAASLSPRKLMRALLAEVSALADHPERPGIKRVQLFWCVCVCARVRAHVCVT